MKLRSHLPLLLIAIFISTVVLAEDEIIEKSDGIDIGIESDSQSNTFPWQLLIDRGKLYGCVFENLYYSPGAILIAEKLPRKCRIDPNRDGFWAELDERELEFYEASVKSQLAEDAVLLSVSGKALSQYEMRFIRILRSKEREEAREKARSRSSR